MITRLSRPKNICKWPSFSTSALVSSSSKAFFLSIINLKALLPEPNGLMPLAPGNRSLVFECTPSAPTTTSASITSPDAKVTCPSVSTSTTLLSVLSTAGFPFPSSMVARLFSSAWICTLCASNQLCCHIFPAFSRSTLNSSWPLGRYCDMTSAAFAPVSSANSPILLRRPFAFGARCTAAPSSLAKRDCSSNVTW
jgi:hypothetical protein